MHSSTSQLKSTGNQQLAVGNDIKIICLGEVGKPLVNLTLQKILTNGTRYNITISEIFTSPLDSETCSFYQNVTATITLSAEDNNVSFRCTPESFINDDKKFVTTGPINVDCMFCFKNSLMSHSGKLANDTVF